MIKILFFGLGSIGQRHVRVIKKILNNKKVNLYCLKTSNKNFVIDDNLKKSKKNIFKFYKIKKLIKKQILSKSFDYIFITNEISKHVPTLLKYQGCSKNFFIEKPISSDISTIKQIQKINNRGLNIYVGYQLRFHPGIKIIKKYIKNNKLGKLISGNFNFGEFLPMMHRYENYRKTHMAIKNLGGGVISCLSHEIDLILYLIGMPKKITSFVSKSSNLKINVEDNVKAIFSYSTSFRLSLNMDFLTYPPQHFIILNFEKGTISWDYFSNKLTIYENKIKKKYIYNFVKFNRNIMFEEQIKEFLNLKPNIICKLDESLNCLKLISKLKNET